MLAGRTSWIVGSRSSTVIVVVTVSFRLPIVSFAANLSMHGPLVAVHPIADGVVFTWYTLVPVSKDIVMLVTFPTRTLSIVPASVTVMFILI